MEWISFKSLSSIKDWITERPSITWSLVVVIGLMLWGPGWFVSGLGLATFIDSYREYLGVIWLVFLIAALAPIWAMLGHEIGRQWRIFLGKRRLKALTPAEKQILERYIDGDTRTQTLNLNDGVAAGLRQAGIIVVSAQIGSAAPGGVNVDHNIRQWAWDYLRNNRGLLLQTGR